VATNFLGINTPAIMATEAQYAEMWVQDAVTMYTYSAAAAAAGVLQPLTPVAQTTNPAAAGIQSTATSAAFANAAASPAASGLGGILSNLTGLLSNPASIGTGLFNALPPNVQTILTSLDGFLGTPLIFNGIQQFGVTGAWFLGNAIPTVVSFNHTVAGLAAAPAAAAATGDVAGAAAGAEGALASSVAPTGLGGALTAGLGEASSVGGLSVPASWSAATPATLASSTAPLEGSGWTVASEEAAPVAAMPGMPGMAAAAKGAGAYGAGPRYGFKPIVMPKQVVV